MRRIIFAALVCLIPLTAIPYGTFEPWWKAAFVCAVFALCVLAIIESMIGGSTYVGPTSILLPMLALAGFAFFQTIPFGGVADPGLTGLQPWHAISADPYQTRFFALQILASTVCLATTRPERSSVILGNSFLRLARLLRCPVRLRQCRTLNDCSVGDEVRLPPPLFDMVGGGPLLND